MKKQTLAATALTIAAGSATAGGIQRDGDRSQILFEEGKNYFEASVAIVNPSISGNGPGATSSGDITTRYQNYSFGYKRQLNDQLSFALYTQSPYGADIDYSSTSTSLFAGSDAEVDSFSLTGLVKYDFTNRISAYGGLRVQSLSGDVTIINPLLGLPAAAPYTLDVSKDYELGYVLGAAYQIPEIALKVAVTYESELNHEFRDNTTGAPFDVTIPQAITLHAQSGIAKDTLLFGSVRWQEWTEFEIRPADFLGGTVPIASEPSDIFTFELGLGRKFTENWSGAVTFGYEEDQGDTVGNLSGKDGFKSIGLAAKYETEHWELTAGIKYFDLGGATTTGIGANFSGNEVLAAGLKLGVRF